MRKRAALNSKKVTPLPVLVIAEIGVNHNGDINLARKLITAAHRAGADVAKFQLFAAESLVTKSAPAADYQKNSMGSGVSQFEMLKKLELSEDDFQELFDYCNHLGIEFMASGFSTQDVDTIVRLGARRMKIPSGEITNLPYLRAIARHRLPTIMSTGMATFEEVLHSVNALTESGLDLSQITLLHCTTDYPTAYSDVNLRVIPMLRDKLNIPVGYSDHTEGTAISGAAVALGASVIEKHLTLNRNLPGPDHRASLQPDEFSEMVAQIRAIELGLGNSAKKPTRAEERTRLIARKSIVANKSIERGEVLGTHNLTTKRPGTGLTPMAWDAICGQIATRDYVADELIDQ
jgi:N,N'-diacetyllegionaminate synthase